MTTYWLSPVFNGEQFFDNNGVVLANGKIFAYTAGSFSVQQTIFVDDIGTPWTQPIVLNSSGRLPSGAIWLNSTLAYNLAVYMPDGVTILKNVDNVTGVPVIASSGGGASSLWVPVPTPTYVSGTQFLIPGNYTVQFAVGNRVQLEDSSSVFYYGTVTGVSFSGGNTQVTIANDAGAISSLINAAWYSEIVATGITGDAGAISYSASTLAYSNPASLGYKIRQLDVEDASLQAQVTSADTVWVTTGTGSAFVLSPAPAANLTINQTWNIRFHTPINVGATLNISGTGAALLKQYAYDGSLEQAVAYTGVVSQVIWDGTEFVLLDKLPDPPAAAAPHGSVVFTSNGTFTPGTGVTSVTVYAAGGGGGGGGSGTFTIGSGESTTTVYYSGGTGGSGAIAIAVISVTPLTPYTVTVGAGGTLGVAGGGFLPGTPATPGGNSSFGSSTVVGLGGGAATNATSSGPGANGAGGGIGVGVFGFYGSSLLVGSTPKGLGGAPDTNGSAGCVAITW